MVSSFVPRKEITRSLVSCTVSNLFCSKEVQMDTDADGHSCGSRIYQYIIGGSNPLVWVKNLLFDKFFVENYKNERNLTEVRINHAPLGSPMRYFFEITRSNPNKAAQINQFLYKMQQLHATHFIEIPDSCCSCVFL